MNTLGLSVILLAFAQVLSGCKQQPEKNIDHTSHQDTTHTYACPMHPEVTGKEGDTCSKCGMQLEKVESEKVSMTLTTTPENIEAGKSARLILTPRNNAGVVSLEETHERKLHLIAVREDLSWFDHIHPQPEADGSYTISETFPTGGNYILYADYKPTGSSAQTDTLSVHVHGNQHEEIAWQPNHVSETDGYSVSLEHTDSLFSGSVSIPIVIRKAGKALKRTDLEDYLGAAAHIILISVTEKDFLHVHPETTDAHPVLAHAAIKKPGLYRMWVQFQTQGIVHTADFTIDVKAAQAEHHHAPAAHKH